MLTSSIWATFKPFTDINKKVSYSWQTMYLLLNNYFKKNIVWKYVYPTLKHIAAKLTEYIIIYRKHILISSFKVWMSHDHDVRCINIYGLVLIHNLTLLCRSISYISCVECGILYFIYIHICIAWQEPPIINYVWSSRGESVLTYSVYRPNGIGPICPTGSVELNNYSLEKLLCTVRSYFPVVLNILTQKI